VKGERKWLTVPAHGGKIDVYAVKGPLRDDNGDECDAWYSHDKRKIKVRLRDETLMRSDLLHELLHAAFGGTTVDTMTQVLGKDYGVREEIVVAFLERNLFPILAKLLKIRKAPRW
jgi:hypothetical protein